MQGILELDIVSGSSVGHGTPDFDGQSERSNHGKESQSTVAGPPSCASVALRRRLGVLRIVLCLNIHTMQCFIHIKCVDSTSLHLDFLIVGVVVRTVSSLRARGSDHDQSSVRVQTTITTSAYHAAPPADQEPAMFQRWFKILQSA